MASQHCYMSHEKTEKPKMPGPNKKTAKNNNTLPYNLKTGIERLSGVSMDNVTVHYNSPQPAQLQTLAYTQGTDIHIAAGQEKHLPHEAWHVVQQKRRRVQPTTQITGVPINDDSTNEHEADVMGEKALQLKSVNCNCIQREKLGEGSFSFVESDNKSSIKRPDMETEKDNKDIFSLLRYANIKPKDKAAQLYLSRDHIIPYQTIMKFTNKVCNLNDKPCYDEVIGKRKKWFRRGVNKMLELGNKGLGKYYNVGDEQRPLYEYNKNKEFNAQAIYISIKTNNFDDNPSGRSKFDVIHKAISWMPGNIMIAPSPKLGDTHSGNDFDDTCKNIIPNEKYEILKTAYDNMHNFLAKPANDGIPSNTSLKYAATALKNLQEIITWDGPYEFKLEQWDYDKNEKKWKNILKD